MSRIEISWDPRCEWTNIYLNPTLPYRMYLHDPKLFMLSGKPLINPHIELLHKYPQNSRDTPFISIHGQYISATKHTDIDRADSPCEERTDYSFTSCVKKNITQKVGCRPQWDSEGHKDRKCTTKDQIIKHLKLHSNLSVAEQKLVIKMTGCLLPCTYTEYKDEGGQSQELAAENKGMIVNINFATTQVTIKEEEYIYHFSSFMAEFGGTLGISFLESFESIRWFLVKFIFKTPTSLENTI